MAMRHVLVAIIFFSVLAIPLYVSAQLNSSQSGDINVELIPENPNPNQVVNVNITSFTTDLNAAKISWRLNGTEKQSGTGLKTFSFSVGDIGTLTTLAVIAVTNDGKTIQKTVEIRPSTVDLVWQSESFTPPFYKGKALFIAQNKITFVATPHINNGSAEISPKNLIYTWKLNNQVVDDASGYGKTSYTLIGSIIPRPLDVTVGVSSPSGGVSGLGHIVVEPGNPNIIFYNKDPLYGIQFQKALNENVSLDSQEISVIAIPFYFGILSLPTAYMDFKWAINGTPVDNNNTSNIETFRQKVGTVGVSNISVKITNTEKILQYVSGNFNLEFNKNN